MNIINRILHRKAANNETDHTFRKILVCYEAHISFETAFLVHFYDGDNNPFLLEKKGNYFNIQQHIPFTNKAHFRVHVFNPRCLANQQITISIKIRNKTALEKTFEIASQNMHAQWYSVKANLI